MQIRLKRQYISQAVAIGLGLECWFLAGLMNGYAAAMFIKAANVNTGLITMSFYSPSTWLETSSIVYTWAGMISIFYFIGSIFPGGRLSQIIRYISAIVTAVLSCYGFYLYRSYGSVDDFDTSAPLVIVSMASVLVISCFLDFLLDRSSPGEIL